MTLPRVRLGELLVEAQIINREQLRSVLQLQEQDTRRLGTLVVEAGLASEAQVTQVLSHQLSVPWVSLYKVDFSRPLLDRLNGELAKKHGIIPIFMRRMGTAGRALYVAMEDPSDEAARQQIAQALALPVRAMIAPPSEIRAAVHLYYALGKDTPRLADVIAQLTTEELKLLPAEFRRGQLGSRGKAELGDSYARDSDPEIEIEEVCVQAAPVRAPSQDEELSVLEGVELQFAPMVDSSENKPQEEAWATSADLLATLRASLHGVAPKALIGEPVRWEALLGAILSVLIKKQVVLDQEFVAEYRRLAG